MGSEAPGHRLQIAATLLEPALLDQAGSSLTDPHGPRVRTAGTDAHTREEMNVMSTGHTMVRGRRLRLAVAGAAVLTALMATTALTDINDRGQLLGGRGEPDGTVRGFVLERDRSTMFAPPGAVLASRDVYLTTVASTWRGCWTSTGPSCGASPRAGPATTGSARRGR